MDDLSNQPRSGLYGVWDQFAGPGVTPPENGLVVGALIAAPGLAAAWAIANGAEWFWWQWAVLVIFACDLVGGLAANGLACAKRWHHRPGQGPRTHFTFAALHIHPLVFALAMPDAIGLRTAMIVYGLLLAGAGGVLIIPARLKGAVGLILTASATVICSLWIPLNSALGWMPLVLYLKVLCGYLTPSSELPPPSGPWS